MSPFHSHQNGRSVYRWLAAFLVLVGCPALALAGALQISAGSVGEGQIFSTSPAALNVDAEIWNGSILSYTPFLNATIAPTNKGVPGRVEWSAMLDQDLNPGGPLAAGRFHQGGTLRITGDLWSVNTLLNPDPGDKVILEASWVSAFELEESYDSPNKLVSKNAPGMTAIAVHMSGGWLYDHGYLEPWYGLTYNGLDCEQDSGPLTDFQYDIISTSTTSMLTLAMIPEPSAALLMLGLTCLWAVRRRS